MLSENVTRDEIVANYWIIGAMGFWNRARTTKQTTSVNTPRDDTFLVRLNSLSSELDFKLNQ